MEEQGHTITSLAEKCGYSRPQLSNLLIHGSCRTYTLEIIADGLGVPLVELLPDETAKLKVMLDPGAYKPTRAHEADAGLDLYAMEAGTIPPCGSKKFDTGVHAMIPAGYVGLLTSKSGLMSKNEVTSRGTIDSGYVGSIRAILFNHSHQYVHIEKGQKITQLVILPIITPEVEVVESLEDTERGSGGFGSTGKF